MAVGVNVNVRNAYAHEHYRILDFDEVELWTEPRGKKPKWGPHVFKLDALYELLASLDYTIRAFGLVIAVASANWRSTIIARGWYVNPKLPKLTLSELSSVFREYARRLSFSFVELKFAPNDGLSLSLRTRHAGVSQAQQILMGGDGFGRKFDVETKYVDSAVREQLARLAVVVRHYMTGYKFLEFVVNDPDDKPIGKARLEGDAFAKLENDFAAAVCADDSVGEAKMSVKVQGPPIEASGRTS